jgi:hypothetical protein
MPAFLIGALLVVATASTAAGFDFAHVRGQYIAKHPIVFCTLWRDFDVITSGDTRAAIRLIADNRCATIPTGETLFVDSPRLPEYDKPICVRRAGDTECGWTLNDGLSPLDF